MKITIFGSGYVGLVTAACFADVGNDVVCVDVDDKKIAALNQGQVPIYEPGLSELILKAMSAKTLRFTTDAAMAVEHGHYQFIAVGTPPNEDGSADLKYVVQVARTIAQHMNGLKTVISKSTVPVGTADKVKAAMLEQLALRGVSLEFDVVSNPEFLKEGDALADFNKPDRIVIGVENERASKAMHALYAPFNRNHDRVIVMDVRSSEMTKYVANAMLATKISFMNEMANLADKLGADIERVRVGIGADSRIGYHFIYPGCGYGGSCFPKDVKALVKSAADASFDAQMLRAVEAVNNRQKTTLFDKLTAAIGPMKGKRIAVWGLAFKPRTDDVREAPSRILLDSILANDGQVVAHDPVAMHEIQKLYPNMTARGSLAFAETHMDAVAGADALVIVTEWRSYQSPDLEALKAAMKTPVIIDGRNMYDPSWVRESGFVYDCIGRPAERAALI